MHGVLNRKGQSAVEFLVVIALALLLIVPTAAILFSSSEEDTRTVEANQMVIIGNYLLNVGEEMNVMAPGSYMKLEMKIPDSLSGIQTRAAGLDQGDLVLKQRTPYGENDIVVFSEHFLYTVGPNETSICLNEVCNLTGINSGTNFMKIYHNPGGYIRLEGPYDTVVNTCTNTGECSGGICVGPPSGPGPAECKIDCLPIGGRCSQHGENWHSVNTCQYDDVTGKNICTH